VEIGTTNFDWSAFHLIRHTGGVLFLTGK
jgi:hypothetical protein